MKIIPETIELTEQDIKDAILHYIKAVYKKDCADLKLEVDIKQRPNQYMSRGMADWFEERIFSATATVKKV